MKYLSIVFAIIIVLLLIFRGDSNNNGTQVDYTYVSELEDSIAVLQSRSDSFEVKSNELDVVIDTLYITLEKIKIVGTKDEIIDVQDTIITRQKEQIITLKSRVEIQELQIDKTTYMFNKIIEDKDVEIKTLRKELRKEKRKRILVTIGAGVVVIGVIVLSLL